MAGLGDKISTIRSSILLAILIISMVAFVVEDHVKVETSVSHNEFIDSIFVLNIRVEHTTQVADSALMSIKELIQDNQIQNLKLLCQIAKNPIAACAYGR